MLSFNIRSFSFKLTPLQVAAIIILPLFIGAACIKIQEKKQESAANSELTHQVVSAK